MLITGTPTISSAGEGERIPNLAVYGISVAGYLVIVGPGVSSFKEAWDQPVLRDCRVYFFRGLVS